MATTTSDHSHGFTYPDEGDTGWTSTMATFFQAVSDDLDSIGTTEITLIDDTNGNEMMAFSATASAVNYLSLANSATGNSVTMSTLGDDAAVGLTLDLKGSSEFLLNTSSTERISINDSGVQLGAANARVTTILDEDTMSSDSATALATQQSIKAYVDTNSINNVVEDTTPQLGGQLDVNGNAIGDGTLELLSFTETGSAVNHVNITNAATGGGPTIAATGDDVNVDLNLDTKAAGDIVFKLGTTEIARFDAATSDLVFSSTYGINFGDETLATYDEGSFTPAFSRTGNTFGYDVQTGRYTKVGTSVTYTLYIDLNSVSGSPSGNLTITGLPFTSHNPTGTGHCGIGSMATGTALAASTTWEGFIPENGTIISVGHVDWSTGTLDLAVSPGATHRHYIGGSYISAT